MITQLKPTNLIAVEVPEDSSNARVCVSHKYYHVLYDLPNHNAGQVDFLYQVKILGEVTKDKVGFGVEPYVEKDMKGFFKQYNWGGNGRYYGYLTPMDSFLSLLAANGLYFENPEGESYPYRFAESDGTLQTLDWHRNKWKEFKDKLIKGKLLILEKL